MDDDFLEELIGVSAAAVADVKEDHSVVLRESLLAVERAVLETKHAHAAAALETLLASGEPTSSTAVSAIEMAKLLCDGQYADVVRTSRGLRLLTALAQHAAVVAAQGDSTETHMCTTLTQAIEHMLLQEPADSRVGAIYEVFFVGIAFVNLYVQANYTGPAFEPASLDDINARIAQLFYGDDAAAANNSEKLHSDALVALQVDGESPFAICESPQHLLIGRCLLHVVGNATHANWSVAVKEAGTDSVAQDVMASHSVQDAALRAQLSTIQSAAWWNARAAVTHERLLLSKASSNTLWFETRRGFMRTVRAAATSKLFDAATPYLRARLDVEWGLAQHHFDKNKHGKRSFEQAQATSGLTCALSGSMGKRTKFQQKSTAQMVLLAASKHVPSGKDSNAPSVYATAAAAATHVDFGGKQTTDNDADVDADGLTAKDRELQRMVQDGEATYRDINLDQVDRDNILHEHIAFEDASLSHQANLQVMDQVILLALCLDVQNSNANDGLTREEMFPYITRVLENPNNWMVYSTALLERAWLECETSKRRERAILQMQALVDQHTTRLTITQSTLASIEDAAPASERMAFVYALAFPPRYALQRDLAERYLAIGVVQSALELFERLEMWDDVVKCYQLLDKPLRAEALIRARLEVAPTPYMWCCLGDVTQDVVHYETSWTLSKHRFARAKRSLGRVAFEAGDLDTAIRHYEASVDVNPMHTSAWFVLGSIAMRLERWRLALQAFTRVAQLDPENGEAWGNIGSIHMRTHRYAEAFAVLQEALKQKRYMWQMWENYALCAMETNKFSEAIYALHQHLDLRAKHKRPVDVQVLAWLVEAIVYPVKYAKLLKEEEDEVNKAVGDEAETARLNATGGDDSDNEEADAVDSTMGDNGDDEDLADLDEAAIATDKTPPRSSHNLKKQLALLFGRITSITTTNPKIWQIYAHFNDGISGREAKALDCRLKMCRALQRAGWETDKVAVTELCKAAVRLADDYVADGSKKSLYACRLYIRGVLKKAQVDYAALDEVQALAATLERVSALEAQL